MTRGRPTYLMVLAVVGATSCSDASPATEADASPADGASADAADATSPPVDAGNDAPTVPASLPPMPVISRKVPAFASSGKATDGNDDSYDTEWRSSETTSVATPSWLAYDLSSVATPNRGQVDVVWYSGGGYTEYDLYAKNGSVGYNAPRDYVIQGNAAPGGSLPSTGWVDLAAITGNTYLSRQLPLNLSGYNWVRMFVTAINGTTFNFNTSVNLDVHDTSLGLADSWLFLGDSITAFASRTDGAGIGAQSFAPASRASFPPQRAREKAAGTRRPR